MQCVMFISIIMFIFVAEVNHRYHFCGVRSRTLIVHGKSTRRKFRMRYAHRRNKPPRIFNGKILNVAFNQVRNKKHSN